jgi:hypothetical protein
MCNDKKIIDTILGKKIISVGGDDFDCGINLILDDNTEVAIYPTEFVGAAMLGFRITSRETEDTTTHGVLSRIKSELEVSVDSSSDFAEVAARRRDYQAAADIKSQSVGRMFAIALINQELDNLEDKE